MLEDFKELWKSDELSRFILIVVLIVMIKIITVVIIIIIIIDFYTTI